MQPAVHLPTFAALLNAGTFHTVDSELCTIELKSYSRQFTVHCMTDSTMSNAANVESCTDWVCDTKQ